MTKTGTSRPAAGSPTAASEAFTWPEGVAILTDADAWTILDEQAQKTLGISGEEFARRWYAGEFTDPDQPEIMRLYMMLPLGR